MSCSIVSSLVLLVLTSSVSQANTEVESNSQQRVVGGLQATPGQFPYQASVRSRYYYPALICGGSVVHQQYILTAAQCVYDKYSHELYVSVGSVILDEGWSVDVERIILRDPYFEPNGPMDIALLQVYYLMDFLDVVRPIPLSGGGFEPDVVNATGWGWPWFSGYVSSALQYVTLETTSNSICTESWGSQVTSDKMCTKISAGRSTCGRDMGGPLVFHGLQIGVIGWGDEDCNRGVASVHTRIAPYFNWISNIISGRLSGTCSERPFMTHVEQKPVLVEEEKGPTINNELN